AAPSPLAGLLDRADRVFSLAWQLGWDFQREHERRRTPVVIDNNGWQSRFQAVQEFCDAVVGMQDEMVKPPDGFKPVAAALLEAARLARDIRASFKNPDAVSLALYLDFWPHLNSVAHAGRLAVREVTKARRLDDPFAFLDQPT